MPHGARPGSKVKTWVHRSTSHAGFEGARSFSPQLENGWLPAERSVRTGHYIVPAGFSAGQTLKIMCPSRVTEGRYCLCCGRADAGAPAPAPAAAQATCPPAFNPVAATRYFHIAPNGERCPYSASDNALLSAAVAQLPQPPAQFRGYAPAVRVGDVALPDGRVLRFEVRFGQQAHQVSVGQSGMVQVNIDSGAWVCPLNAPAVLISSDGLTDGTANRQHEGGRVVTRTCVVNKRMLS